MFMDVCFKKERGNKRSIKNTKHHKTDSFLIDFSTAAWHILEVFCSHVSDLM